MTADFALTERISAPDWKCQEGLLGGEGVAQVLAAAAQDILAEFWLLELDRAHVRLSQIFILSHHLRTLDAFHLVVVLSIKDLHPVLVFSDIWLLQAAGREGMALLNPETV